MTAVSFGRTSVLVLVLLFLAVLSVTTPIGDFPLNDDWVYGRAVRHLLQNHEYRPTPWTSMTLLTQVLWGWLFSLPFGFSFTALRFSTLLLALATLLCVLFPVRRKQDPLFPAMLAPLVLLFNPVYLNLSHTFMTDVPFIAFMLGSVLLLVRGAEHDNKVLLALGVCLAVLATLLRQTGVLIPIAFGITLLSRRPVSARKILFATGFVAGTVLVYLAYTHWLSVAGRLPDGYFAQWSQVLDLFRSGPGGIAGRAARSLLITYVYLGIFTLPLGLLFLSGTSKLRLLALLAVSTALLAAARFFHVDFAGNILSDRGVGPFTLAHSPGFTAFTGSPVSVAVLGFLALVGGALMIEMLSRAAQDARSFRLGAVCLSFAALYSLSISLVTQLDRYMLPYLPFLAIPALSHLRRKPPAKPALIAALSLTAAYAAFSVSAVHDYMAWNRTRWQAVSYLTDELGVPVDRLDGGFEFNGLHAAPGDYVHAPGSRPWQLKDADYVIAFDAMPGYDVLDEYPVRSWLPYGIKRICVLRRGAAAPG